MALNFIWLLLFFMAGVFGLIGFITGAQTDVFGAMTSAAFESAKSAFELALGLTGMLTFWMGLMRVGEKGGAVAQLSRFVAPLMKRVFPGIPSDHPAMGAMTLNFAANLLGLDNAATPAGLQAMRELQTLNLNPDTVTDHQSMFMVLHAASLTLIPISIIAFRDAMKTYGADSFAGRLACLFNGSTDTTLYVIALYSGAVGLKNTRHVLPCALIADLAGFIGAIVMALVFFRG